MADQRQKSVISYTSRHFSRLLTSPLVTATSTLGHLEQAINRYVTIVPESETPAQMPEIPVTKQALDEPPALLPSVPGVSTDEVKSVVDAISRASPSATFVPIGGRVTADTPV